MAKSIKITKEGSFITIIVDDNEVNNVTVCSLNEEVDKATICIYLGSEPKDLMDDEQQFEDIPESIIARLRREAGYRTQEQLASVLNVDRTTVAKWESGRAFPRAKVLVRLASCLGCSIDDLLDKKE